MITPHRSHRDPASEPRTLSTAINASQRQLLSLQREDGHWCGELEGDSILESEYVLVMVFLGKVADPRMAKAAATLRQQQCPNGGWAIYPGGPAEVSATVKAYFALKLLGEDPQAPHMKRAQKKAVELGGLDACNSFTKFYLAIFQQIPWSQCPAIPPEILFLPQAFAINLYEMSSWSRDLVVPLCIVWAHKLTFPVPEHAGIPELRTQTPVGKETTGWHRFFFGVDRVLKLLEKSPFKPTRAHALAKAERWIVDRLVDSDGLGAIFPAIVYTLFALRCRGYEADNPTFAAQVKELEKLELEGPTGLKLQPCFGPVWDTALVINALVESGLPRDHPALQRAGMWLLDKRGRPDGDWRFKNPEGQAPGWYFEYANGFNPDNDTTAKVVTALSKIRLATPEAEQKKQRAIEEAHAWHVTMQNDDGGWGAFDKNCNKTVLTYVPFADHNAMIDPSNEDITGRILETFAVLGKDQGDPAAARAVAYLHATQHEDGSWYGRWGCNYIYGTWLALCGLERIGETPEGTVWGKKARDWIQSCQNNDGGWGELPLSYDDPREKGKGPSTPSQTAWALMGLFFTGDDDSAQVERGIGYLLAQQKPDGSWDEFHWTGTGFPSVFYLRYDFYRLYFPLLALSTYRAQREKRAFQPKGAPS